MRTRKKRRQEAKESGVAFVPRYNGGNPVSYEEYYGVGYERFNNKFVTIKEIKKK